MRIFSTLVLTSLALLIGSSNPSAAHVGQSLQTPKAMIDLKTCLDGLESVQATQSDRFEEILRDLEREIVALRSDDQLPPALIWAMTHHLENTLARRLDRWESQTRPVSHSIHLVRSDEGISSAWNVTIGRGYVLSGSSSLPTASPASREFHAFVCALRHDFQQVVRLRERLEAEQLRDAVFGK